MSQPDVVIIDYGVGNLFNVQRAFKHWDVDSIISRDPEVIQTAKKLLLPGVGAFEAGMQYLRDYALVEIIREYAASGRPLLGICLGMQLLMSQSDENGLHDGLDLVRGRVVRFQASTEGMDRFKIPQIGWNALKRPSGMGSDATSGDRWRDTVLDSLGDEPYVYFIHSYFVVPDDSSVVVAVTDYGKDKFCSVLKKDNLTGCQFHPERSGEMGLKILKNFISTN